MRRWGWTAIGSDGRQRRRASVRVRVERMLDRRLPESYDAATFQQVCDVVYEHIYDAYANSEHHIYSTQPATG